MSESGQAATILVIDDDEVIRQCFSDQLEDLGYRVLTAENGRIGIKVIEQQQPDLVLTDLRMPEMGGLEVIRHARDISIDIPFIVVSGAGRIDDVVEALRLGAYDYLVKPVNDLGILGHTLSRALEKASLLRSNLDYQEQLEGLVRLP